MREHIKLKHALNVLEKFSIISSIVNSFSDNNISWNMVLNNKSYKNSQGQPLITDGYETDQMWEIIDEKDKKMKLYIQVYLNQSNYLIEKLLATRLRDANVVWSDAIFTYEKIDNIEEIKTFPHDFKQER